jgi:hypothetical protein
LYRARDLFAHNLFGKHLHIFPDHGREKAARRPPHLWTAVCVVP